MSNIDYSLYYDYLFCTLKANLNKSYKNKYKLRTKIFENKFYNELEQYFATDDFAFSKEFQRKGLNKYLLYLKGGIENTFNSDIQYSINKTFYLDRNINLSDKDNSFFSFTVPIYTYIKTVGLLNVYVFDFSTSKLNDRRAIISGIDYSALLSKLFNLSDYNVNVIKIHILSVCKVFKCRELVYDLRDYTKKIIIESKLLDIVELLYSIDNKEILIKESASRFNCSKCAFAYMGLCSFGNIKYFDIADFVNNDKQIQI